MTINIRFLQNKLEKEYYTVFSANSAEKGIIMAKEINPDIILMDIIMNNMDGFVATQTLREMPETKYTPIIMTTALNSPEEKLRGLQSGADEFMSRPLDMETILIRINSLHKTKILYDTLKLHNSCEQMITTTSWRDIEDIKDSITITINVKKNLSNN